MSEPKREYSELKLARGLIFHQDHILLVQNLELGHFYLPGGKVDPGESVLTALIREFQEELAWQIRPMKFLGCYENAWRHPKKSGILVDILEMNFLWTCERLDGELNLKTPDSMEKKISFHWAKLSEIQNLQLLPSELKEILPRLHRELNQGKILTFWGTSLKPQVAQHYR